MIPVWGIARRSVMRVLHRRHVQPAFPFGAADRQAGRITGTKSREAAMTGETRGRTVVGNISLSLDGRVTGPGGESDMGWIVPHALTDESRSRILKVTSAATTALLGRKSYQGFGGFWPAVAVDEDADPRDRALARWLNEVEKVVVSRTVTDAGWHNSRIVADHPAEVVRQLRMEEGGDIVILASSSVIRTLLEAGELDRLSIILCPELVGAGARLFGDGPAGSSWALAEATPTSSGALCLLYDRIRPAAGQRPQTRPGDLVR
jgi:dihydrofolate reductase